MLKTPSKFSRRRLKNDRSLSCSLSKIEDDVPIAIHFDNVLEFGISNQVTVAASS